MAAPWSTIPASTHEQLERAREAAPRLAQLSSAAKNTLLRRMAEAIETNRETILEANARDLASSAGSSEMQDRLMLNPERIRTMAEGVREVAALPDPLEEVLAEWTRPNGLHIRKVRVPLGVIGIIYESRPNVTVDSVALACKAGNAIVLRGGKEARHSNQRLVEILSSVEGLTAGSIELLDSGTRDSVEELIKARGLVDVVIPRGGAELISYVTRNSTVPVIETGAGNCHIFIDRTANLDMADRIVINAKTQRPSVCNAAEKLLVHQAVAAAYIPRIVGRLAASGVEVRGDELTVSLAPAGSVVPAEEADWSEEYLRLCIAIRIVDSLDSAIAHINRYSTQHSDSIVTSDAANAQRFLRLVDSAAVYWNASTRFSDGGEFGFGAEMGISTQKLHCRGPFALAELTSFKYLVTGSGQIRS
jgi:glutamate-5-semialdehyde dehydrogenase